MSRNSFLLPISIGRECDILVHNSAQLRDCQRRAFDTWLRVWTEGQGDTAAHEDGRAAMLSTDTKNVCCYRWALVDCLTHSARSLCGRRSANFDLRHYAHKRDQVVLYYETFQCAHYPFGSLRCHLPTWLLVIIIIAALGLLLSLGVLAVFNFNLHKRSKRSLPVTDL